MANPLWFSPRESSRPVHDRLAIELLEARQNRFLLLLGAEITTGGPNTALAAMRLSQPANPVGWG